MASVPQAEPSALPRPARRVLAIDADGELRSYLDRLTRDVGFEVEWASSDQVFEQIPPGVFPVIVADLTTTSLTRLLPRLSGIDRNATWILFTDGEIEDLRELPGITSSIYLLSKPADSHDLRAILRTTLLEREVSDENYRLKSLLFGLKRVNAEKDFNTRLDKILELALELAGGESGSLMLLDEESKRLTIAAARNLTFPRLAAVAVPVGEKICGYVAQAGYGLLINPNLKDHPFFGRFMHRDDIGSAMSVPLITGSRLLGVMNLNRREEPFFSSKDLEMASLMAETVTLYIDDLLEQARAQRSFQDRERAHVMTELASALAHELRNPLTAMAGYAELMVEKDERSERADHFRKIQVNAGRIHRLIEDLKLLYSDKTVEASTLDVNFLIEDCVNFVAFQNPTNRVRIRTDLCASVGPVVGDERDLMQVFVNLLNNAHQSIEGEGEIQVVSRQDPQGVHITISDSGNGIETDLLPKIFSAFYTTRKRNGGTGMGLAIVKAIVDRSGGQVTVESLPGKGASFSVFLPRPHP